MTDILSAAEIDALFDHGVQGRPAADQGDGHTAGARAGCAPTDGRLQFAIDEVFGLQNATAAADHTENLNEIPIPETEV
jgi:hypothetical protein